MGGKKGGDPKDTNLAKSMARVALEMDEFDRENLSPKVQQMIQRVQNTDAAQGRVLGDAGAQYEKAFGDAGQQVVASRAQSGGDVKSGLVGLSRDRATSKALGLNDTTQAFNDLQSQAKQGLVQQGLGQAGEAVQGLGQAAEVAQQQSIEDARASAISRGARNELIGAGLGLAAAGARDTMRTPKTYAPGTGLAAVDPALQDPRALGPVIYR